MIPDEPSQLEINNIIDLVSKSLFQDALEEANKLLNKYPNNSLLNNISGACHAGLGRLEEAVKLYKKAIKINPEYAKAHYNLAGSLHDLGSPEDSIKSYLKSIDIEPKYAEAHNNLGNVYRELSQFENAVNSYESAIALSPKYIQPRYSLAIMLQHLGDLDSIRHFEKIIFLKPNFAEAHNNLGVAYKEIDRLEDSIESYKKAILINPLYSEAHNNLGNAYKELGDLEAAVQCYKKAIEINPKYPLFHNNLGNAYKELGDLEDAVECYNIGIKINPDYPDSYNNLGVIYVEQGNLGKAIKSFEKVISISHHYEDSYINLAYALMKIGEYNDAIEILKRGLTLNPDNIEMQNSLGNVYIETKQLDDAIRCFENTIQINSNHAEAYHKLAVVYRIYGHLEDAYKLNKKALTLDTEFSEGYAFQGRILLDLDQLDDALNSFEKARFYNSSCEYNLGQIINTKMDLCSWDGLQKMIDEIEQKIINYERVTRPLSFMSMKDDPYLQKKASIIYANHNFPNNPCLPKIENFNNHVKIHIGYFSADFKLHPVAALTAELYEMHDREKFTVHAISFGPDTNDELNLRVKEGVDHFHDVEKMTDRDVANYVRSLEIDIAIDLGGFTADSRTSVFAMKIAPIQVNYLGFPGTMGAGYMDYIIADHTLIPKNMQKHFLEKIAYMPDSYMVNDTKYKKPSQVFSKEGIGLPEDVFVFCCFNAHYKITQTVYKSWMQILLKVEESVLWLADGNLSSINNLIKYADECGVDSSRLIFAPQLDLREDHLNRIKFADLFLDTLPYNAHATTSDALQKGVPVLTCMGSSFPSRVAASLLSSVNLPELITNSRKEYELLAIELATNPKKFQELKNKLSINLSISPLFNTALFTKNLETVYFEMNERYQKGQDPDHIYVNKN